MKKTSVLVIISLFIVAFIGIALAYRIRLINLPFGNIIVKNDKYGFEFSYPRNRNLRVVDEWDNGLPGSNDGGVYGYRAEGGYEGPFTDQINISIYNVSLEEYLSRYKIKEFGWQVKNINKYGADGKILSDVTPADPEAGRGTNFCKLLFENKSLLYIVSCDLPYFKFYK
jgi:hypothetical protein